MISCSSRCTPSFHQLAHDEVPEICSGPSLPCMNRNLRFIGKLNRVRIKKDCFPLLSSVAKRFGFRKSNSTNVPGPVFKFALIVRMRVSYNLYCTFGPLYFSTPKKERPKTNDRGRRKAVIKAPTR